MKANFVLLLQLCTCVDFGQSKKEKEQGQKDMQTKIDTLTKTNKQLTTKSDSLSKELGKYFELYTVIKDKVVKSDFDPARMATIIDSFNDFKGTRADFRMYFMNTLFPVYTLKYQA